MKNEHSPQILHGEQVSQELILREIAESRLTTGWNINPYWRRAYHFVVNKRASEMYEQIKNSPLSTIFKTPDEFELARYIPVGILLTTEENAYLLKDPFPRFDLTFQYGANGKRLDQDFRINVDYYKKIGIVLSGYIFDERIADQGYAGHSPKEIFPDKDQQEAIIRILGSDLWMPLSKK